MNIPPVAVDDELLDNPFGSDVVLNITDNDTDSDGTIDPSTVDLDPTTPVLDNTFVTLDGTYIVDQNGNVTFEPIDGLLIDPLPIEYTVQDNEGNTSNEATITITYLDGLIPPVAEDDLSTDNTLTEGEDNSVVIDLLVDNGSGADSDIDGVLVPSTINIISGVDGIVATDSDQDGDNDTLIVPEGIWFVDNNGVLTFTPSSDDINFDPEPITYTILDNDGLISNEATVIITFAGVLSGNFDFDDLEFFNAVSNTTGFTIGGVQAFPDNTLKIYNRWGVKVFDQDNYTNDIETLFRGRSNGRVTIAEEEELPTGTYYYVFEAETSSGTESKIGFLYISRF